MDTLDKNISETESLSIIRGMIDKVKADMEDKSFYNLFWGWLVFFASISHFVLLKTGYAYPFIPWLLMPVGAIVTIIYSYRHNRTKKVRTYVDEFFKYVMIVFGVSLLTVLVFQSKLQLNTYPMVMLIYGNMLFVYGATIRFKPLILGGIANWIFAIIAFFVLFDIQLLLLAAAVVFGFIIPGYSLKNHYRKNV